MRADDVIAGRYRLDRPLGEGGMGEVWAATHTLTEQRRALKFVHAADEGAKKRMLREARAASAVRHPNVVAVHDVVEGPEGAPVLVMDLLEGETLADRLEREGRLSPAEAVRIVREILAGLEAAHAQGIVHRDLKPANVFLEPAVKLLDFGVAKLTAESGPARATNVLTDSGAMVGTPCYMAPEQAFGDGVVDVRSDLWAVGVILYEALAGVRPADGATVGQVFKVLATGAIVPLEERAPELPRALTGIVARLLTTEREGRPAAAGEVANALAALAAHDLASAHVPPATRTARMVEHAGGPEVTTAGNTEMVATRPPTRGAAIAVAGFAAILVAIGGLAALRREPPAAPVTRVTAAASPSPVSTAASTDATSASPPAPAASPPPSASVAPGASTAAPASAAPKIAPPPHDTITTKPSRKSAGSGDTPKPATTASPPSSAPKLLTEPMF